MISNKYLQYGNVRSCIILYYWNLTLIKYLNKIIFKIKFSQCYFWNNANSTILFLESKTPLKIINVTSAKYLILFYVIDRIRMTVNITWVI